MTPAALDSAARALARSVAGRDEWDAMDGYLREQWRRRAATVLRLGQEET